MTDNKLAEWKKYFDENNLHDNVPPFTLQELKLIEFYKKYFPEEQQ